MSQTYQYQAFHQTENPVFSILIPTWNNLDFLKNCVESIQQNSSLNHQILVFVNEGKDGTKEWLEEQKIDFVFSPKNEGICYAVNALRTLAEGTYIVYLNDDMYALPHWDKHIMDEINRLDTTRFVLSGTLIEPIDTGNDCVVIGDFGSDLTNFQKEKLLAEYEQYEKVDWSGSTWPPTIVHKEMWDLVGGYSIEFFPGFYSDPDFTMKLYQHGVRIFKGVGKALIYHFGAKSTSKHTTKHRGRIVFLNKWDMTSGTFLKYILKIGQPYELLKEKATIPSSKMRRNQLKKLFQVWK